MVLRLNLKSQSLLRMALIALMVTGAFLSTSALVAADLKQRIKVSDVNIRLSDIFTDISIEQDKDVFTAPTPGHSKRVSTTELWKIAQLNGVDWEKPLINKPIRIMREGHPVDLDALRAFLSEEMRSRGIDDDVQVSIYGLTKSLYLPVNSDIMDIEINTLTISSNRDRYRAKLLWPVGDGSFNEVDLNGSIEHVRAIPVLNRTLLPGEVIARSDIAWANISIKKITANTIQSVDNFIGYTPRRAITANKMIRTSDIEALKFVIKGSQVSITFVSGPLVIKTIGKALQHGAMGDAIRILNMGSNKTIIATVTGPDQVEISRPNTSRQLASR